MEEGITMSFKELYQSKKMDADQALNLIRSGDLRRTVLPPGCFNRKSRTV